MVEDDDLLAHFEDADDLVEDDFVHDVVSPLRIAHLLHSVKGALQRRRPVARVEAERALLICLDELSHIQVVGQSGGETDQPDRLLVLETSREGARDEALEDETTIVVQQMNLIDDHAVDQ